MGLLTNLRSNSEFGLVMNQRFHEKRKWVSALTPYLVEAIIERFQPTIISSQLAYEIHKRHIRYFIVMEPGFAAPRIKYDRRSTAVKAVFYSDPHYEPARRFKYFQDNCFDYVFSFYFYPFWRHFPTFPKEKFVHFPWSIPDRFLPTRDIRVRGADVVIFGAQKGGAYDMRNWCRNQSGVSGYDFSGVENKKMSDEEYFEWLSTWDAIIAAGSSDPKYDLVTPKYYEIAASGALLFGQKCKDLEILGFDETKCVIFDKNDFHEKIVSYKKNPGAYLDTRSRGLNLIRDRHLVSHRIKLIEEVFNCRPETD
jgi:hypothetical protein